MLEKYVFFVSKQPVLIELVDVYQVIFSRLGQGMGASASRSFDLKITTKSGPEYVFSSIMKEEKNGVEAYLIERKVKVKNEKVPEEEITMVGDDDEDEEMASIASGSEADRAKPKKSAGGDLDSEEEGRFRLRATFIVFRICADPRQQTRTLRLQALTPAPRRTRTQMVREARPLQTPVVTGMLLEEGRKLSRNPRRKGKERLRTGKARPLRRSRRRRKLKRIRMRTPWMSTRAEARSRDPNQSPSNRSQKPRRRMQRMDR